MNTINGPQLMAKISECIINKNVAQLNAIG